MQVHLHRFVRLAVIVALLLPACPSRADEVAGQWRGVSRIRGTISVEYHEWVHEGGIREGEESDKRETAEIRFTMEADGDHGTPSMIWRAASASITGSIHGSTKFNINKNLGPSTIEASFSGAPVSLGELHLTLDPRTGVWQLVSPGKIHPKYPVVNRFYGDDPDIITTKSDVVPSVVFDGKVRGQPGAIQGSYQDEYALTDQPLRGVSKVGRVQLWPEFDDLGVEVTIKDYDKWLPQGSIANPSTPGNFLVARATLVPKGGRVRDLPKVTNFRFELVDVSHEPGVCMNWPLLGTDGDNPPAKDPAPDLRFMAENGAILTNESLTAEMRPTKDGEGRDSASVRIASYDYGGSAELRVRCVLEDGREVTGILKNGEEAIATILLPFRRSDSRIAHLWQERNKVAGADSEDLDDEPAGDGNRGDGFSNYEEYRGFVQGRMHLRTKPGRKDFFVQNRIGQRALPGIFRLADITQLAVQYELRRDEMPVSRSMNINRSAESPRTSPEHQHGVILELIGGGVASMADIEGDFWRPKTTTIVVILSSLLAPQQADELSVTIAHELLHSISVRHHGETDEGNVAWSRGERVVNGVTEFWFEERGVEWANGGFVFEIGQARLIRIFRTDASEVLAQDFPNFLKKPKIFYVGCRWGQHSGVVDCVMRYDCANAFTVPGFPHDRILSPGEPIGLGLCSAAVGTDFNAPGLMLVRYADATRGVCEKQFCVRDDAPEPKAAP